MEDQPPRGSPKSHLFRTKDAPQTQEIPKAAGAPDQEKTKYLNKRCSQSSSHGGNHQSPSSSVPGTRGRDQHGYFPLPHGAGAGFWTKTRDSKARALRTVLAAGRLSELGVALTTRRWFNPSPLHNVRQPITGTSLAPTSPRRTHNPADGVVGTGHGLDLTLEHSLLFRGEGAEATQGKAAAHLQADLLPDGSQGVLQVEGAWAEKGRRSREGRAREPSAQSPQPPAPATHLWTGRLRGKLWPFPAPSLSDRVHPTRGASL